MNDKKTTIEEVKAIFRAFVDERDWGQFHTPKNISMGLAAEAAELMEFFIWSDGAQSVAELEKKRTEVEHEVADVFMFLLALSSRYNIDLASAVETKLKINAQKYPVELAKGKSDKYTSYQEQREKNKAQS